MDIRALQEKAGKYKVLPDRFLKRRLKPLKFNNDDLVQLVGTLSAEKPLYTYSDMRLSKVYKERIPLVDIITAGPQAIPLLEAKLDQENDPKRRVLLAQALAQIGSKAGVPVLIGTIMEMLSGGHLPRA